MHKVQYRGTELELEACDSCDPAIRYRVILWNSTHDQIMDIVAAPHPKAAWQFMCAMIRISQRAN